MSVLRGEGVGFGDLQQADDAGAVVVGAVEDPVAVGTVVVVMARDDDPLVLELRVAALERRPGRCGRGRRAGGRPSLEPDEPVPISMLLPDGFSAARARSSREPGALLNSVSGGRGRDPRRGDVHPIGPVLQQV